MIPSQVQGNEGASSSKLLPVSPKAVFTRSPPSWTTEDEGQRRHHPGSFDEQAEVAYRQGSQSPSHLAPLRRVDKGILRDPFATATITHPVPCQNVAFLDPPSTSGTRSARSTSEGQLSPLVFNKRPTLASARSSVSCSSCTCSSPFSGDEGISCRERRTPSLSRSETDRSEGDTSTTSRQGCHRSLSHGGVSLLTAALVAGEVSPRKQVKTACGILRREVQETPVFDTDSDSPVTPWLEKAPSNRPRFVEPPKPARSTSHRTSLSPPAGCSPTALHESPDSNVGSTHSTLHVSSQGRSCSMVGVHPQTELVESLTRPTVRRRLTFQDAEEVEERIRARSDAARRASERMSTMLSSADESSTSRRSTSGQSSPTFTPATTFDTADRPPVATLARVLSPALAENSAVKKSAGAETRECKLKFAASPSELVTLRRSSTLRGRATGRRSRESPAELLSDDDGQPYVDTFATGSSSTARPESETPKLTRKKAQRSVSPAPARLGGPENHRKGGRARSPAPRGRVAMPRSFESAGSEEDVDPDDLDYDEDDEDDSDEEEDEEEDSEGDNDSGESVLSTENASHGQHQQSRSWRHRGPSSLAHHSSSTGTAATSNTLRENSELQASINSATDPPPFTHFDFEEEGGESLGRDYTDVSGATSPHRSPFSSSATSPLPFARSRLPSAALSDAGSSMSHPRHQRASQSFSVLSSSGSRCRPSISPMRSKTSAAAISHGGHCARDIDALEAAHRDPQRTEGTRSASRSFSAAPRCAPSLITSSEQVQALPSSPPIHSQSPDAWTHLRSCLMSVMGEEHASNGLGMDRGPGFTRRPLLSALSTPGGSHQHNSRSLATSPRIREGYSASKSTADLLNCSSGPTRGGGDSHVEIRGVTNAARPSILRTPAGNDSGLGQQAYRGGRMTPALVFDESSGRQESSSSSHHRRTTAGSPPPPSAPAPPPPPPPRPIRIASEGGGMGQLGRRAGVGPSTSNNNRMSREDVQLSGAHRLPKPKRRPYQSRSPPSTPRWGHTSGEHMDDEAAQGKAARPPFTERSRSLDPGLIENLTRQGGGNHPISGGGGDDDDDGLAIGHAHAHAHHEPREREMERKIRHRRRPSQMEFGWGRPA